MIEVNIQKNNVVTNYTINDNVVTIKNNDGNIIRTVITETTNEKTTLRNIIYSNYDSHINVLNIY